VCGFLCFDKLMELLAIRPGYQNTIAKSLVISTNGQLVRVTHQSKYRNVRSAPNGCCISAGIALQPIETVMAQELHS
jgi:hypothetical protein